MKRIHLFWSFSLSVRWTKNRRSRWFLQILDGAVSGVEMNRGTSEALAASWRTFKRAKHPRIDAAATTRERASAALSIAGYLSQAWQPAGRKHLSLSDCAALSAIQLEASRGSAASGGGG